MKTKLRILNTAREEFNKNGYEAVVLSDLAVSMGISRGNLTYHFQKKEAVILSLLAELKEELSQSDLFNNDFPSFELLQKKIWTFFQTQRRYAFIFNEDRLINKFKLDSHIEDLAKQFCENEMKVIGYSISLGNLKPEPFPGVYDNLTKTIWLICYYWLRSNKKLNKAGLNKLQKQIWSLIIPHFTDKGLAAFEKYFGKEYLLELGTPFNNNNLPSIL